MKFDIADLMRTPVHSCLVLLLLANDVRCQGGPTRIATASIPLSSSVRGVSWAEFAPNGKYIVSRFQTRDGNASIVLYDCGASKLIPLTIDSSKFDPALPSRVAFSPDSMSLLYSAQGRIRRRPVADGSKGAEVTVSDSLHEYSGGDSVWFAPGGKSLYAMTLDDRGWVRIHKAQDYQDGRFEVVVAKEMPTLDVVGMSGGGEMLLLGYEDRFDLKHPERDPKRSFTVISLPDGNSVLHRDGLPAALSAGGFGPDNRLLAIGDLDGRIAVWDVRRARLKATLTEDHSTSSIQFHPSGKYFAYSVREPKGRENVRIVDARTFKRLASFVGSEDGVGRLCFSADGRSLAVVSFEPGLHVWDVSALLP